MDSTQGRDAPATATAEAPDEMARPIWKGQISFGLVNIPVTLYSAEVRNDLSFRLLDSRDRARVRYERVNEATGEEVPWNQVVRGYEYDDGSYVLVSDEDLKRVAIEATQTVEIEGFVDREDIDLHFYDKPYYLVPGKKGEKGYVLLREALKKTGKVGIARVVIRTRQYLAAVIPMGDGLVLDLLRFAQEIRNLGEFNLPEGKLEDYKISDKELDMAETLISSMSMSWNPEEYHDEYRDALMKWLEERIEAGQLEAAAPGEVAEAEPPPPPINIMELLKKSVQEQKSKRKEARKRAG